MELIAWMKVAPGAALTMAWREMVETAFGASWMDIRPPPRARASALTCTSLSCCVARRVALSLVVFELLATLERCGWEPDAWLPWASCAVAARAATSSVNAIAAERELRFIDWFPEKRVVGKNRSAASYDVHFAAPLIRHPCRSLPRPREIIRSISQR